MSSSLTGDSISPEGYQMASRWMGLMAEYETLGTQDGQDRKI